MQRARLSPREAPSPREDEAARRDREAACAADTALFFPGLGHVCQGRTAEAATLMSLGAAELGTAVAVAVHRDEGLDGFSHPAAAVPLVGFQNVYLYSWADAKFQEDRARHLPYVPQDTMAELAYAPFNPSVLSEPDVWAITLVSLAAGIGLSGLVDESLSTDDVGDEPNLFGKRLRPGIGYPLAGLTGVGLFEHVALGEESIFRGTIQSEMARQADEDSAWVASSLVFGFAHAPNALALEPGDRVAYLAFGVPFITVLGSSLGLSYRLHDYSLAAPVAIHFWYDFLLSATFFALHPQDSPLSARVSFAF
ncbi:MAG: CPBP family intramembrane glutamic endopeptidase [Polyangiaceae bacterium]